MSIVNNTDRKAASAERSVTSERQTSRAWWFLGTLAVLRNPEGAPRVPAVIELTIPPGGSPPLHLHDTLDDSFLVLEGEVVVRCDAQTIIGRPGTYVTLPKGVPHTFRVTSEAPAHLLSVHADDSFLAFIEEIGTPTGEHRLPPDAEHDDHDREMLAAAGKRHDLQIVGPPLRDEEARSFLGDAARQRS